MAPILPNHEFMIINKTLSKALVHFGQNFSANTGESPNPMPIKCPLE